MIRVEISVNEVCADRTPEVWAFLVQKKLREAGIPALDDGTISHGRLQRFNDITDFGKSIYEWYSDDEWLRGSADS